MKRDKLAELRDFLQGLGYQAEPEEAALRTALGRAEDYARRQGLRLRPQERPRPLERAILTLAAGYFLQTVQGGPFSGQSEAGEITSLRLGDAAIGFASGSAAGGGSDGQWAALLQEGREALAEWRCIEW